MIDSRLCPIGCKQVTIQEVTARMLKSGAVFYGWRCSVCHRWTPTKSGGSWIAKDDLLARSVVLELLPVVMEQGERCARCGQRGAELHHWSPRAIFGDDADSWPQDYLCKGCHDEWHQRVTPQLVRGVP